MATRGLPSHSRALLQKTDAHASPLSRSAQHPSQTQHVTCPPQSFRSLGKCATLSINIPPLVTPTSRREGSLRVYATATDASSLSALNAATTAAAAAFQAAVDSASATSAASPHTREEPNGAPLEDARYPSRPKWRRVLLKVSGEALAGDGTSNIDPKVTAAIAKELAIMTTRGVQVGIVVGGGNFFRGASWVGASGLHRASADHIGMMATVMNAIFLQGSLESLGVPTRVQTAFRMSEVAEPYIRRRAIRHLEKGRVVIFAAGTGNPFFTTDTAAALRAAEIDAEVVLKGTNVDGVYDSDPKKNKSAVLIPHLSLREVTVQNLRVMDITAATLCAENNIPVVVFNLSTPGNITRALSGEPVGTLVTP